VTTATNTGLIPRGSGRKRLLDAALRRFAETGTYATRLEEIRVDAGVSVGALYHHFVDKAGLAAALYVELTRDYQEAFLAELRERTEAEDGVRGCVRLHFRWVVDNPDAAAFLMEQRPQDDPELRALNQAFFAEVMTWWRTHVHYGQLRDLPPDLLNALWLGPAQEYTRHWLADGKGRPPSARHVKLLSEAAWRSLNTKEQQ
jgi:AcrR family transcriptional regulator